MVLAYLFVVASFLYGGAVYIVVVESARFGGGSIIALGNEYYSASPSSPSEIQLGILILCGLAASAALFIVWSLAVLRGQYLRRRQEREWVDDSTRSAGDAALELLLENRVNELEMSIDRLTAQRNDLVTEVRAAEARTSRRGKNGRVVIVPESSERLAVVETPPEPEIEAAEPVVEAAPAAAADEPA
ncbi:MAG TPA: hypothetical protein VIB62_11535, partial [Actinomycetota bacterium]